MMKVVVTLADGYERSKYMILRSMFIVKRRFTEPVGEGVDAKGALGTEHSEDGVTMSTKHSDVHDARKQVATPRHKRNHPSSLPIRDLRRLLEI